MPNSLTDKLDHSRVAYRYAIAQLPNQVADWPYRHGNFTFKSQADIDSMRIELGWAFFCRYEGCVEAHLKENDVKLSKQLSLKQWLEGNGFVIPEDLCSGLDCYRQIRNRLHHQDGASFDGSQDSEIHLLPEHMENFYQLFSWIGDCLEEAGQQGGQPDAASRRQLP